MLCSLLCRSPDLIIEVAHPCVTTEHGAYFLQHADYMVHVYVSIYVHSLFWYYCNSAPLKIFNSKFFNLKNFVFEGDRRKFLWVN